MKKPIEREIDEDYDTVDSALGIALMLILVVFCAFGVGLVYQLASPWIAEILKIIWGWIL